nr:ATP-grasp fold amidoligase family protein [Microvirga pakistanensis]
MTFSEHLHARRERWWVKRQLPQYSRLSGKLEGRSFMKDNGFKVPEEIGLYPRIEEIPEFSNLPNKFVLKPSSGYSAKNVFVISEGVNLLDGKIYNRNSVIDAVNQSYAGREFRGKFLIEELLINWDQKDGIPLDYKFYCFGERIAFVHVVERNSGVNIKANRHWFMKDDWSDLGFKIQTTQELQKEPLPRPACYKELIDTVRTVGRMLNMFMRIDMYATTRGAVFGEFTPTPHGGSGYTKEADQWLGSLWKGVEGASTLDYRDFGYEVR